MKIFELVNLASYTSSDTLSVSLPTAQSYLRMETARIVWSADANPSQHQWLAFSSDSPRSARQLSEVRVGRPNGGATPPLPAAVAVVVDEVVVEVVVVVAAAIAAACPEAERRARPGTARSHTPRPGGAGGLSPPLVVVCPQQGPVWSVCELLPQARPPYDWC